jgi:hypothetical protein
LAHDSALADEFPLTHESLALMLGYQRAGVSIHLRSLVTAGLIEQKRGMVCVIDRPRLEAGACGCYAAMRGEADELFSATAKATRVFGFKQSDIIGPR